MLGLRGIVDKLIAAGISGDLWVDGSFLTEKLEPGDTDVALEVSEAFFMAATTKQRGILSWLGNPSTKSTYMCHAFSFCDVPAGHAFHPGFDIRGYWLDEFGSDRGNNPKGIVVLAINGGVQ